MNINFKVTGLAREDYLHIFSMNKEELAKNGVLSYLVDSYPGYPCRVSLEDAQIGEEVFLFSYQHHAADSPYRASGPIFIRKNAIAAELDINELPKMLAHRLLSLRTYNHKAIMIDARTVQGSDLRTNIIDSLKNPESSYIQVHNAGPGCYNCEVHKVV